MVNAAMQDEDAENAAALDKMTPEEIDELHKRLGEKRRQKEEARQNFIAAAQSSFEHYKETGLHITLDEFSAWVDQVQQDPGAPVPPCHS